MTDADPPAQPAEPPWEPPLAGSEAEHLLGALNRLRMTFRWKADGLDEAGLRSRIGASGLTIAGLLKHVAFVEDYTWTVKLRGDPPGEPWQSADWSNGDEWVFASALVEPPSELYGRYDEAVGRAQRRLEAALAGGGLDQLVHLSMPHGPHASLRRLVCDLIEEYGRHTGHADLLREAIDGVVGEDPPASWRPSFTAHVRL